MQSDQFIPGYEPEILDQIEKQHNEGRVMPFIEFPLLGGKRVIRLLGRGGLYVCGITPEEATDLLRCTDEALKEAS